MKTSAPPVWWPRDDWRSSTLIGELVRRLRLHEYEQLRQLALREPAAYWAAVMQHLGFQWRRPYDTFLELPEGPAWPRWFEGGRLNFVDNVLRHAAGDSASRPAVIAENEAGVVQSLTYAQLAESVMRVGAGLQAIGVKPGDRVGLMMGMGVAGVTTFLALAALGAIAVPLFTGFGAQAAAVRLQLAGAQVLIASSGTTRRGRTIPLDDVLEGVRASMPQMRIVVHGPDRPAFAIDWEQLHAHGETIEPRTMSPDDPFMIVFTSGTTGQPKGTVHTHAGFPLKIAHDSAYHFDLRPGDRWLWPSDMGWVVGPITTIGALCLGATLVCYDGAPDHPGAQRLAQVIDRHRVTHFGASPTLLRLLASAGGATRDARLDSLKLLMVAGEVIAPEHFDWYFRAFGRAQLPVINYSGGTEASGALLASVPCRPIKACGFNSASPGVDAYAVDPQGARVVDAEGDLVIGAPFIGMTQGFWNDGKRYLESYWSAHPGVWAHGDLIVEDADGHFFILGRSDDTLKIAGKRVGPAELEAIALGIPGVEHAAATAVPHPIKGDAIVICAVVASGASDDVATRIGASIENALGKAFRPAAVHLVAELPRTRNGKVMRRVIRNVLRGQDPGDLSALENPSAVDALKRLAHD